MTLGAYELFLLLLLLLLLLHLLSLSSSLTHSLPHIFLQSHHRKLADSQLGRLLCILLNPFCWNNFFLKLTPRGVRDNVVLAPVHDGFVGGDAANVLPAVIHWIGQAVTLILKGDWPESKTGLGRGEDGSGRWTCSVLGSMAYCHWPVASNSRSTARGCCAFWARTFWLLGTFERKKKWMDEGYFDHANKKKNLLSNAKLKGPRCTAIEPFGRFSYQENAFQKEVSLQLLLPLPLTHTHL